MKLFTIVAISAAAAAAAASASVPVRGSVEEQEELKAAAIAEANEFRRKLGQTFNPWDDGAGVGCNCAGDAIRDVSKAQVDAIEKIPYVTLALLQAHTEENGDTISGLPYDPLDRYKEVIEAIFKLVKYAVMLLRQIDCNVCGIDGYDTTTTTERGTNGVSRNLDTYGYGSITPYEDISHYECCCDVFAIRDITISRIHDIIEKHLMSPGGFQFSKHAVQSLVKSGCKAIAHLAKVYLEQFGMQPPKITCLWCPCFDGAFLDTQFDDSGDLIDGSPNTACNSNPSRAGVAFNNGVRVCVAPNCANYGDSPTEPTDGDECVVFTSDGTAELIEERTYFDITQLQFDSCRFCIGDFLEENQVNSNCPDAPDW